MRAEHRESRSDVLLVIQLRDADSKWKCIHLQTRCQQRSSVV
jgi:hypothetical protein